MYVDSQPLSKEQSYELAQYWESARYAILLCQAPVSTAKTNLCRIYISVSPCLLYPPCRSYRKTSSVISFTWHPQTDSLPQVQLELFDLSGVESCHGPLIQQWQIRLQCGMSRTKGEKSAMPGTRGKKHYWSILFGRLRWRYWLQLTISHRQLILPCVSQVLLI